MVLSGSKQESTNPISHPPSSPKTHPQPTENPSPPTAGEAMANFPVDPHPFLLGDMLIDHGWNRPARGRIALGGEPTREHEEYAIVSVQPMPEENDQLRPTLTVVSHFLEHN